MGADMVIAAVRSHDRMAREIEADIAALTAEQAAVIFHTVNGESYDYLYDEGNDEFDSELEFVQDHLTRALTAIRNESRELTYLHMGGVHLWITGGMSWGDDPTELFQPFLYAEESGFF